jgi:hypothetical protein
MFPNYFLKFNKNERIKQRCIKEIANEKKMLTDQLKILHFQFERKMIDKETYKRFRQLLETYSRRAISIRKKEEILKQISSDDIKGK